MEIEVELITSESSDVQSFTFEQLGVTQSEWELLTQEEQHDIIEKEVFDLPSQPYWMVDTFTID